MLALQHYFTYTLGNIAPKHRSTLGAIQLFAVLKTSLLEKYGCDRVLETFMEDVRLLEAVNYDSFFYLLQGWEKQMDFGQAM